LSYCRTSLIVYSNSVLKYKQTPKDKKGYYAI